MKRTPLPPRKTFLKRTPLKRNKPAPIPPEILEYWAWIRKQRCIVGYQVGPRPLSDVAHVGIRGLGQKSDHRQVLPICRRHHTQDPDAHHRLGKKFWAYHRLDRDALVAAHRARYKQETGKDI